jgi:TonB family protein
MNRLQRISFALCGALLVPLAASAQAPAVPSVVSTDLYVPAEPLERTGPEYPKAALSKGRQGWAKASFVISTEGKVIEAMIEESSHHDFDAPTLRAVENWQYQPATLNGKPVEQSMVETTIRYQIDDVDAGGAGPQFVKRYRATQSLIVAKNFAEAAKSLQSLEQGAINLYQDAWLWWLKYVYLEAMGGADPQVLMEALRKALGSTETKYDNVLEPDVFVLASQRLYVLSVRSNDFGDALSTLERLKASEPAQGSKLYKDVVARLEPTNQEILSVVASPQVLRQEARVDAHNYWVHRMLRRSFSFGEVKNGQLDVVDLRCTRANRRLVSVPEDAVLKLPASWGDCRVYIKGEPGTTFSYEEYPDDVANTVDPAQLSSKAE